MKISLVLLRILAAIVAVSPTSDYCSEEICDHVKHIACGHNGNFAKSCPKDANMVSMTNELKNFIVNYHNEKRNFVAGGGDDKLRPACRMATMAWDDELAELAALNVKQCKLAHDKCHNTDAFEYAGQNIAWTRFKGEPDHATLWKQLLDLWYAEIRFCKQIYIDAFPDGTHRTGYGHFTIMVADRNIRVGCAASHYSSSLKPFKAYLIACNYATANIMDFPVYSSCYKAGINCTTGANPQYPNLCSASEVYEVNEWL